MKGDFAFVIMIKINGGANFAVVAALLFMCTRILMPARAY
jgi:hypothetical protein